MSIFHYIAQGFGWEVGREIAGEAVAEARQALNDASERQERERSERARVIQRRARPTTRTDSPEIARRLAALKRKLGR
jgi:hypothetical protein